MTQKYNPQGDEKAPLRLATLKVGEPVVCGVNAVAVLCIACALSIRDGWIVRAASKAFRYTRSLHDRRIMTLVNMIMLLTMYGVTCNALASRSNVTSLQHRGVLAHPL